MTNLTLSMFDPALLTAAYPALFRLLRHSRLPCSPGDPAISPGHLLQRCSWAGRTVTCNELFTPTVTDLGICCAFNARQTLKETNCSVGAGQFPCLVRELQGAGGRKIRTATVGADMGLQVVLDQHSNLDSLQTLHQPGSGFSVFVGEPGAFPLVGQDAVLVAPGQQHELWVTPTRLSSSQAVADLDPDHRDCLFPTERALVHHSLYSQAACHFECALANASAALGHGLIWAEYFPGQRATAVFTGRSPPLAIVECNYHGLCEVTQEVVSNQ